MQEPQYQKCVGFQENVVLAMKSCFYEEELRCLMIMKLPDQSAAYHARSCMNFIQYQGSTLQKVCPVCNDWFNNLVSVKDSVSKEAIETEEVFEDPVNFDLDSEEILIDVSKSSTEIKSPHGNELDSKLEDLVPVECSMKSESLHESEKVSDTDENTMPFFQCNLCTLSFRKRPSLNKHMNRKHKIDLMNLETDVGKYPCDRCGKRFNKLPSLRRHQSRKHSFISEDQSDDYLSCEVEGCGRIIFESEMDMKTHLKDVHNLPRKGRKPKEPIDLDLIKTLELDLSMKDQQFVKPKSCDYCGKLFESKLKMYWHIKRVHQQKRKPCHLCGLMVKKLSDHVKRQHTEKDLKKFVCEFCGERFKGQSGYQFHIAGHTGEKKFSCRSCNKQFRTSSEAYNCERGHQGIFKWRCSLCDFKSHQKNKYIRHLRTHTKSQPYQCPMCDHRAARKDYLQKHIGKSHSHMSLDEVESSYPNLYKIEEKVQVTGDLHYEKIDLPADSKVEKDDQNNYRGDTCNNGDMTGQHFKVEGGNGKSDTTFKEEVCKVGLAIPNHPLYHHHQALFTPSSSSVNHTQHSMISFQHSTQQNLVQQLNALAKQHL